MNGILDNSRGGPKKSLRGCPRWVYLVAAAIFFIILFGVSSSSEAPKAYINNALARFRDCPNVSPAPAAPPPPVVVASLDEEDAFKNFKKAPGCNSTSQDLHFSKKQVCTDRHQLLTAMSYGGRHGFDQPYGTLGCDMKWLSTAQICETLQQFDAIHIIGDSLMRQLTVAMHIFLREDMVNGARQTWRKDNPPEQDCRCRQIFSKGSKCFWWEAISSQAIWDQDPDSMKCPRGSAELRHSILTSYPIEEEHLDFLARDIANSYKLGKRHAYIIGNGLWDGLNVTASTLFIEQFESTVGKKTPLYYLSPKLFISPSASGERKKDGFVETGNNIYMQRFVHNMEPFLRRKGFEHLGFYNMTVQATSPDGTHANFESTVLEAMTVFNWLHYLPTRAEWEDSHKGRVEEVAKTQDAESANAEQQQQRRWR